MESQYYEPKDTIEESDMEHAIEACRDIHISRRDFILGGLIAMSGLALNPQLAMANEPIPKPSPAPEPDPVTPPEEPSEKLTVQDFIDSYNWGLIPYQNVILHSGYTFDSVIGDVGELTSAINYWGGITPVDIYYNKVRYISEVPISSLAMCVLNSPIVRLYGNSDMPILPAFQFSFGGDLAQYEYSKTERGYVARNMLAATAATPHALSRHLIDQQRYEIEEDSVTASSISSSDVSYRSFSDACEAHVHEARDLFALTLNKYIRAAYNPEKSRVVTADGQFSGIDVAEIYGNTSGFLNIKYGGYFAHAVLLQSALYGILGPDIDTIQMSPSDISSFVQEVSKSPESSLASKVNVIALPLALSDPGRITTTKKTFEDLDLDKLKTILVLSTHNMRFQMELEGQLPENVIYCSTVRTGDDGKMHIPENRVRISDEDSQDKLFLFPDETDALGIEYAAEASDGQLRLIPEFFGLRTSGASLSTLTASTFIAAVASRLEEIGVEYTNSVLMTTLKDLCPKVEIDGQIGRVPNLEKVREFFGIKADQFTTHIPQAYGNSTN